MKSLFLITFTLLAAALSMVSAFSPTFNYRSRHMKTSPTISSINILYMARRKPAKSQEEDVELTRAIIMKHIGSMDDGFVVDDSDDDDLDVVVAKDLVTSDASEAGASDATSTGRKSIKEKLKDKGRKMKNKLKSKMKKK